MTAFSNDELNAGDRNHPILHNNLHTALDHFMFPTVEGVYADGITDDTTALQNVLNNANGRKVVLPPNSTIFLANPVNVPTNTIIEGNNCTLLSNGFVLDTTSASIRRVRISDLTIQNGAYGIRTIGNNVVSNAIFQNIRCEGQSISGMKTESEFIQNTFIQCDFQTSNYGLWLSGSKVHFVNAFYSCSFANCLESNVYLENLTGNGASSTVLFSNCAFQGGRKWGVIINRSKNILLHNCYFEANNFNSQNAGDIQITNTPANFDCEYITLDSCNFSYDLARQQPQKAVECTSEVKELVISNTRLMDNARTGGLTLVLGGSTVTLRNTHIDDNLISGGTIVRD